MSEPTEIKHVSPKISLGIGYLYLIISGFIMSYIGFFDESTVFRIGPPVNITGYEITTWTEYIMFALFFAAHQGINSYISSTTYPYIVNEIQDRKCTKPLYSLIESLCISSLFDIYSMLDMFFIINGTYTNIIFFLLSILVNVIVKLFINYQYLSKKTGSGSNHI